MALAYMSCGASTAATVFGWLQDLVSASAIVHWIIICLVYLRFYYGCKVSSQHVSKHAQFSDIPILCRLKELIEMSFLGVCLSTSIQWTST